VVDVGRRRDAWRFLSTLAISLGHET
jgi:hypothetical protein